VLLVLGGRPGQAVPGDLGLIVPADGPIDDADGLLDDFRADAVAADHRDAESCHCVGLREWLSADGKRIHHGGTEDTEEKGRRANARQRFLRVLHASVVILFSSRQFQMAHVYVECDETGNPLLAHAEGGWWVDAYSRPEWVPGVDTGQDMDLLSLTGVELTRRLPPGTGLRLDPGQSHCLVVVVPAATSTPVESVEDSGSRAEADR